MGGQSWGHSSRSLTPWGLAQSGRLGRAGGAAAAGLAQRQAHVAAGSADLRAAVLAAWLVQDVPGKDGGVGQVVGAVDLGRGRCFLEVTEGAKVVQGGEGTSLL